MLQEFLGLSVPFSLNPPGKVLVCVVCVYVRAFFFLFIINCYELPPRDIKVTLIKVVAETSALLQHVDFVKTFFIDQLKWPSTITPS